MKEHKVIFKGTIVPELKDVFAQKAPDDTEVVFLNADVSFEEEKEQLKDAMAIVTHFATVAPDQLVEKPPKLQLIQAFSQGVDHLPVKRAAEVGVYLCNNGGRTGTGVAEHTVALIMAAIKRLNAAVAQLRTGKKNPAWDVRYIHRITGSTVGIVGFGKIGREVARMVYGMGAKVICYDAFDIPESLLTPYEATKLDTMDEVFKQADIVSLHVPLTPETKGMIGEKQFKMMKPTAVLVNAARGPVIDEPALIKALSDGTIASAGLDVFANEPPQIDNPLLQMDNVVATSHIACEVWEDYLALIDFAWENIYRVRKGEEPESVVKP